MPLFSNPFATSLDGFSAGSAQLAGSLITDFPGDVATAFRSTRVSGSSAVRLVQVTVGSLLPAQGERLYIRFRFRSSAAFNLTSIQLRPAAGLATDAVELGSRAIVVGTGLFEQVTPSITVAPTATAAFVLITSSSFPIGATFDVTDVRINRM